MEPRRVHGPRRPAAWSPRAALLGASLKLGPLGHAMTLRFRRPQTFLERLHHFAPPAATRGGPSSSASPQASISLGLLAPPPGGVRRCPVWFRLAHLPDDQRRRASFPALAGHPGPTPPSQWGRPSCCWAAGVLRQETKNLPAPSPSHGPSRAPQSAAPRTLTAFRADEALGACVFLSRLAIPVSFLRKHGHGDSHLWFF